MNAIRKTLLAAALAVGTLPGLAVAGEPMAPERARAVEQAGRDATELQIEQGRLEQRRLEEARARLEKAAAEVARLSGQMGRDFVYRIGSEGRAQPRALLGVVVDRNDEKKDGAHVREVSPGGAAAEAGIKPGDVITSIAGQDFSKEPDPGRVLVEKMGQVEPNLKVQVGVLRDGKKMNFDVTPRPAPRAGVVQLQRLGELANNLRTLPGVGDGGPDNRFNRGIEIRTIGEGPDEGARFRDMEFATLSEKLGGYFGVKSGVLVVRAGANSAFKLQDGNVILAIDGREPTSAQHAGRILRSYGDGEKLKLRVQRDRKAQDIEITMTNGPGERGGRGAGVARPN